MKNIPSPSFRRVATIDIGSNTIKSLVLQGPLPGTVVHQETREVRISEGISGNPPRLAEASMVHGAETVAELVETMRTFAPEAIQIAATSAVRDATNQADFSRLIRERTGIELRILSGAEEAAAIGTGILHEPLLEGCAGATVSDLGGGSLEVVGLRARSPFFADSFQVGSVRFLERFVENPKAPLSKTVMAQVMQSTLDTLSSPLREAGLHRIVTHVGTGGSFTIARNILAHRAGLSLEDFDPKLPLDTLVALRDELADLSLAERLEIPGLPSGRADVLPIALTIVEGLGEVLETDRFLHSLCNLRRGLASAMLTARHFHFGG